jgi:hypothetical protein
MSFGIRAATGSKLSSHIAIVSEKGTTVYEATYYKGKFAVMENPIDRYLRDEYSIIVIRPVCASNKIPAALAWAKSKVGMKYSWLQVLYVWLLILIRQDTNAKWFKDVDHSGTHCSEFGCDYSAKLGIYLLEGAECAMCRPKNFIEAVDEGKFDMVYVDLYAGPVTLNG